MKKRGLIAAALMSALVLVSNASATEEPSEALGERLFNDSALAGSPNGKKCSSCHPGGKGLEEAASNPKMMHIINVCITGPLEGKAISDDSLEMRSLKLYIQSLKGK